MKLPGLPDLFLTVEIFNQEQTVSLTRSLVLKTFGDVHVHITLDIRLGVCQREINLTRLPLVNNYQQQNKPDRRSG